MRQLNKEENQTVFGGGRCTCYNDILTEDHYIEADSLKQCISICCKEWDLLIFTDNDRTNISRHFCQKF